MADFPMPGRPSMPAPLTLDERGFCALPPAPPERGEKRSAPGVYSGYTFPKYDGFYRHSLQFSFFDYHCFFSNAYSSVSFAFVR